MDSRNKKVKKWIVFSPRNNRIVNAKLYGTHYDCFGGMGIEDCCVCFCNRWELLTVEGWAFSFLFFFQVIVVRR